jgi:lantibiotic biosynthesis protein
MTSWRPLLTGPLADRAWQVVAEIASVLDLGSAPAESPAAAPVGVPAAVPAAAPTTAPVAEPASSETAAPPTAAPPRQGRSLLAHPSLGGGAAGGALFFAYRSRARSDGDSDSTAAATLLDRAIEELATVPLPPDLYGGFSGVAWTVEHLCSPRFAAAEADVEAAAPAAPASPAERETGTAHGGAGDEDQGEDPLAEIDDALLRYLEHSPWTADYDLIRGLAGFGVYALERLPRPSAVACLERVVERLDETAERGPQGVAWHTAPELLPEWQRRLFPGGYYNLGVAHGVPAVLGLLGAAARAAARLAAAGDTAAGALAGRARALLEQAMPWFLAQRLPPGRYSWFGPSFTPETPPGDSRLAWCYGDPGIAAALLVAARACGEPAWERLAVDLAMDAAKRPQATSRVRDAGLCHGSAGLAHLFNRIYQQTGEPALAEASRRWFEHALDFRRPGKGLAGYRAFFMDEDGTESWRSDPGLLEGVTGIGLALLGGLSDFEPAWDRVMMLSAAIPAPPPS